MGATLSFGVWDLDSSASNSQLDAFSLEGVDLTTELNTLFESGGGSSHNEYSTYTLNLGNSFFANLADGLFSVDLNVGGNGLRKLADGSIVESDNNRYFLIYSTLTIETQDISNPDPDPEPVPEPSTLLLFAAALLGIRARIK